MAKQNPIGIFDSGVGGLTITHALSQQLPNENILYYGDTAHHPYGEKSPETIQHYTNVICQTLLEQHCKLILIACNSASSAAMASVRKVISNRALIVNVIDPVIEHIAQFYTKQRVGVIGTKATISSGIYQHKLAAVSAELRYSALATPLLAPAIEEGFAGHRLIDDLLQFYLANPLLAGIDVLILGCTHYPLILSQIDAFYRSKVAILHSCHIIANKIQTLLNENNLLNTEKRQTQIFRITDNSVAFNQTAKQFFGEDILLEYSPLWQSHSEFQANVA